MKAKICLGLFTVCVVIVSLTVCSAYFNNLIKLDIGSAIFSCNAFTCTKC